MAATDPEDDPLTYTLGGSDAASFDIIAESGQLKTKDPLNYEAKASYSVTVSVSDGKDANHNADTTVDDSIDVTITITDEDEAGNVVLSSLQPQVDTPLTARLEDPDGSAADIAWTWAKSSDQSAWADIPNATSATYTPVIGDKDNYLRAKASYTNSEGTPFNVHGVSAYPVRAAPASNDAPTFATASDTRSIPENTPAGRNVGAPFRATDTDVNDQTVLTYSLGGTDAESFTIGMASGQLLTKAALNHETKDSYTVIVTAADPSAKSDTITVTIAVTDVDEAP